MLFDSLFTKKKKRRVVFCHSDIKCNNLIMYGIQNVPMYQRKTNINLFHTWAHNIAQTAR